MAKVKSDWMRVPAVAKYLSEMIGEEVKVPRVRSWLKSGLLSNGGKRIKLACDKTFGRIRIRKAWVDNFLAALDDTEYGDE